MLVRIGRHVRQQYAGFLALFVALGGVSYAAALQANSVGSKQIRKGAVKRADLGKNAVTSAKVKNGSLLAADFKRGQLATGPTGPQGAQGPQGTPGQGANPEALDALTKRVTAVEAEADALRDEVSALQGQKTALADRVTALETTLAGVTRDGDTLRLTGLNLQLASGSGKTDGAVNGLGNLIVGYNENASTQSGSHNIVLGVGHAFTSWGGLVAGAYSTVTAPLAATFGNYNTVLAHGGVAMGRANTIHTGADFATVTGGRENVARGVFSSISGGLANVTQATAQDSHIGGGRENLTSADGAAILGGQFNIASGTYSVIAGGYDNRATGAHSALLGGYQKSLATTYGTSP